VEFILHQLMLTLWNVTKKWNLHLNCTFSRRRGGISFNGQTNFLQQLNCYLIICCKCAVQYICIKWGTICIGTNWVIYIRFGKLCSKTTDTFLQLGQTVTVTINNYNFLTLLNSTLFYSALMLSKKTLTFTGYMSWLPCSPTVCVLRWHTAKLLNLELKSGWQPYSIGVPIPCLCMIKVNSLKIKFDLKPSYCAPKISSYETI
jgi:hypothetical protein